MAVFAGAAGRTGVWAGESRAASRSRRRSDRGPAGAMCFSDVVDSTSRKA